MARSINFALILSLHICFNVLAHLIQEDWNHVNVPCNLSNVSLEMLHTVSNKTIVSLNNCTYILTSPINISSVQGLHIIGNSSVISCIGDNTGLMFTTVTELLLENFTVLSCGLLLSEDNLKIASVKIENSMGVTIKNLSIENGKGSGLSLVNVEGNVTVGDCNFTNNTYLVDQTYPNIDAIKNDFCPERRRPTNTYDRYEKM